MQQKKNNMKIALVIVGLVLGLLALAFGLEYLNLGWSRYFRPKYEDVNREVFKATRSYNEGKVQELVKYRHEYMTTKDPIEKKALAFTIRHTFAEYDRSKLSPELQDFLTQIYGY